MQRFQVFYLFIIGLIHNGLTSLLPRSLDRPSLTRTLLEQPQNLASLSIKPQSIDQKFGVTKNILDQSYEEKPKADSVQQGDLLLIENDVIPPRTSL